MEKYIRAGSGSHKETHGKETENCFIITESPTKWFGITYKMVQNHLQFADCSRRKLKMLDNIEECGIVNMEQICRLFREWKNRETFDKI